jgi:hypothetical protein
MALELLSRLLALVAVVAFTWIFASGRLPVIPAGRWTVAALFAVGLGMCTLAGVRDGITGADLQPTWLTTAFSALGFAALAILLAALVGLSWRVAVVGLAAVIGALWLVALGFAVAVGLPSAPSGVVTLVVGGVVAFLTRLLAVGARAPLLRAAT